MRNIEIEELGATPITENLRFVNSDSIHYQVELAGGSAEPTDIFKRKDSILGANDNMHLTRYA
jgi:S-adenosylmethionine synthetase